MNDTTMLDFVLGIWNEAGTKGLELTFPIEIGEHVSRETIAAAMREQVQVDLKLCREQFNRTAELVRKGQDDMLKIAARMRELEKNTTL